MTPQAVAKSLRQFAEKSGYHVAGQMGAGTEVASLLRLRAESNVELCSILAVSRVERQWLLMQNTFAVIVPAVEEIYAKCFDARDHLPPRMRGRTKPSTFAVTALVRLQPNSPSRRVESRQVACEDEEGIAAYLQELLACCDVVVQQTEHVMSNVYEALLDNNRSHGGVSISIRSSKMGAALAIAKRNAEFHKWAGAFLQEVGEDELATVYQTYVSCLAGYLSTGASTPK
jgi:hypothetical protein